MNVQGLSQEEKRILREAFIKGYKRAYFEHTGKKLEQIDEGFLRDIKNKFKGRKGKRFVVKDDMYLRSTDLGEEKRNNCAKEQEEKLFGELKEDVENGQYLVQNGRNVRNLKEQEAQLKAGLKQWEAYCKFANIVAISIKKGCALSRRDDMTYEETCEFIQKEIKTNNEYDDYAKLKIVSDDTWKKALEAMANASKSDPICTLAYHIVGTYYLHLNDKKRTINANEKGANAEIYRFLKMNSAPDEKELKKEKKKEQKRIDKMAAKDAKKAKKEAAKQAKKDAKKVEKEQPSAGGQQSQPEPQPTQQTTQPTQQPQQTQPTKQTEEPAAKTEQKQGRKWSLFGRKPKEKAPEEKKPAKATNPRSLTNITAQQLKNRGVRPNIVKTSTKTNRQAAGKQDWFAT